MSLINDALKKAQKMRAQDPAAAAPSLPGDSAGPVLKRARPMPARWLAGIAAGAAVLVAGSVLATVLLLRKPVAPPPPKPVAPAAPVSESSPHPLALPPASRVGPAPAPGLTASAPAPIVVVPPLTAISVTAPVPPQTEPHSAAPLPVAAVPPAESAPLPPAATAGVSPVGDVPVPPTAGTEIRPATPAAPVARPDARAQAFVDALRVTGIRASGTDSKVLMNDRVFRLNDIVERTLGLRLTGITADRLSFSDPNGMIYTRDF